MNVRPVLFAVAITAVAFVHPTPAVYAGIPQCTGAEQCDDANSCTADSCVASSCVNDPAPNLGAVCSAAAGCSVGLCDAAGACVTADLPDDTPCPDSTFCDGIETCQDGTCTDSTPACNDDVACTADSCNEAEDTCSNVALDAACNDGLACNGVETCSVTLGCQSGMPIDCSDGVTCTDDVCNEDTDSCVNTPDDGNCDNLLFCDGDETCHPTMDCQDGLPPCTDAVACTVDTCNEIADTCSNAPNDLACDNGDFCDGTETCDPVFDCTLGDDPCEDNVSCTNDTCDETLDSCTNVPDNGACDDFTFCNGIEVCTPAVGCQPGPAETCDDGITCSIDSCNAVTDSCDHTPDDTACSDGLFCNGEEACDASTGCMDSTDPPCGDAFTCTTDSCNEDTDACDSIPDDTACDDGVFCNGEEACDASSGCMDGEDPCADGVACTVDGCDEKGDTCTGNVPDDSLCDNQAFCDGEEACDANSGCTDGEDPCQDSVGCTTDTCIELSDSCLNLPDDSLCNDQDPCTIDSCSVNLDCQNGELPDFDGDGACDGFDNCPLEDNPDQLNSDCRDGEFQTGGGCVELGFDPLTDEHRGCCDGGDVCDPCPARQVQEDGSEQCNPERSGGITCPPEQGCQLTTADGCITVSVPAGALDQERSISVTDSIDEEQNLLARDALLYQVGLRPVGIDFDEPVEVTLCWDDRDDDDNADEGICGAGPGLGQTCDDDLDCGVGGECDRPSTTREEDLVMKRNAAPFSKDGIFDPPYTCDAHDAADAQTNACDSAAPDCSQKADEDDHTVAGCCDTETNTWDLRTCAFGEHFLGEFAGDLVPGNGSRQTDCTSEWSVVHPQNEPYRDDIGMPSLDQTCRDGDPLCDYDGDADGKCTFHVGVCFNVLDRRLTDANDNRLCTPTDVDEWNLKISGQGDDTGDLATMVAALGGGTTNADSVTFTDPLDEREACTRHVAIEAPLSQPNMLVAGGASGQQSTSGTTVLRMATSRSDSTTEPDIGATSTTTTTLLEDGPKCGDANEDGDVLASDALLTLRTAVGSSTCDPVLCDVTTDGNITASDALAILKTAVGQQLETACGLGELPSDRDRLRLTCTP
ncbi:MAG TPA: hypothetical protein VEL28_22110 [Candidatus Binatia bacterium]|nr:hypothetical protein [Candidatus Binatia bacterium]